MRLALDLDGGAVEATTGVGFLDHSWSYSAATEGSG